MSTSQVLNAPIY